MVGKKKHKQHPYRNPKCDKSNQFFQGLHLLMLLYLILCAYLKNIPIRFCPREKQYPQPRRRQSSPPWAP